MEVHQDRCPNCSKKLCFPVNYAAEQFLTICPHCHVGYNAVKVEVDEEFLGSLLFSRASVPFWQKLERSKALFQYLRSVAINFRFIAPSHTNAIILQVAHTKAPYPLAVYFHNIYYQIRSFNSLLLSFLITLPGAIILLALGFSLMSVLLGGTIAILCFNYFIALPKIKGVKRNRLVAEQLLLQQGYDLQQSLNRVLKVKQNHQNLLTRQRSVLEQMLQAPTHYSNQIDLYQRAMKCTDDYLNLCDHAIGQYELAISAISIQIETSKLAEEIPDRFIAPGLDFGLDSLEDQLVRSIPPDLPAHDSHNYN